VTWCAICLRKERGFGFSPHLIGYVARPNEKFCSLRCLNFYAALFRKGNGMVDMTDFERAASNLSANAWPRSAWTNRFQPTAKNRY
jgi:hypothetical protein